jgi:ABC-type lipoprotein export system ATPase subunit
MTMAGAVLSPQAPLIRLRQVFKSYRIADTGVLALDGVDLDIERGEFLAVVGPSGSGKSTILNLIGGLDRASSGEVEVDGRDIGLLAGDELTAYRAERIGFVWQGTARNLVPYLSVRENVRLPGMLLGGGEAAGARTVDELLALVGMAERAGHQPGMLSGGEQQRAAIAVALSNTPAILLADEPTAELDSENARRVLDAFESVNREFGVTIVIVTHDRLTAETARRTIRLRDGRLLPERTVTVPNGHDLPARPPVPAVKAAPTSFTATARGRPSTPAAAATPFMEARDVVRSYPGAHSVLAVRGASIELAPRDFVALMGPSGSGKTTFIGVLSGLDRPDAGSVCWCGRDLHGLSVEDKLALRRSKMGVVFQSFGLMPTLSAVENVELPLRVVGMDLDEARDRAEAWLRRLGLEDRVHNRTFELSAGQQQRIAVARALINEPLVVLADEPIAEVDTENADLILQSLRDVTRRGGAVLAATHNPEALRYASRVVLFRDGRIEREGAPDQLADRTMLITDL